MMKNAILLNCMVNLYIKGRYQMKKIIVNLSIILIAIYMVGCAGLGDYEIELINGYRVVKSSPESITIFPASDSLDDIVVPDFEDNSDDKNEFIVEVGHDKNRYIVAKTNLNLYYIIDTKEVIKYGPLNENEFNNKKEDLDILSSIELKNLEEYTRDFGWTVEESE